jgi:hypothetical protein
LGVDEPGLEANPLVGSPAEMLATGFAMPARAPGLLQRGLRGLISAATDPAIGQGAELAGEVHPALTLPTSLILGAKLDPATKGRIGLGKRTAEQVRLEGLAQKAGITLPVSELSGAPRLAKGMEQAAGTLLPGQLALKQKYNQLPQKLMEMQRGVRETLVGPRLERFDAGETLSETVLQIKKHIGVNVKKAYKAWEGAFGGGLDTVTVEVPNLTKQLTKLHDKKIKGINDFVAMWEDKATRTGTELTRLTASDLDMFQKTMWKTFKGNFRHWGGDLLEALKKDLDVYDAAKGTKTKDLLLAAKEAHQLRTAFEGLSSVKTITRFGKMDPELVITKVFRSGNMQDINALKKHLPPDVWDIAKNRFVENLLDSAKAMPEGLEEVFMPGKFAKNFTKYKKQLQNVLTPWLVERDG